MVVPGIRRTASTTSQKSRSPPAAELLWSPPVTIAVTMNEAITVAGVPTLSLNNGGTATYAESTGTDTLLHHHYRVRATLRWERSQSPVSTRRAIIVDAAGDTANAGVTGTPFGSPAGLDGDRAEHLRHAGHGDQFGRRRAVDRQRFFGQHRLLRLLGVSGTSLGFIAPPSGSSGSGQTAPTTTADWLSVAAQDPGAGRGRLALPRPASPTVPPLPVTRHHPRKPRLSVGAGWTSLPMLVDH